MPAGVVLCLTSVNETTVASFTSPAGGRNCRRHSFWSERTPRQPYFDARSLAGRRRQNQLTRVCAHDPAHCGETQAPAGESGRVKRLKGVLCDLALHPASVVLDDDADALLDSGAVLDDQTVPHVGRRSAPADGDTNVSAAIAIRFRCIRQKVAQESLERDP